MWISLLQTNHFRVNWNRMGMSDEDLQSLEKAIMEDPAKPPVMSGTGGLRKIRFAGEKSSGGKSSGVRICYAYLREYELVYLCAVFAKNEKGNLTAAERNAWRKVLGEFEEYLRDHFKEGWTP